MDGSRDKNCVEGCSRTRRGNHIPLCMPLIVLLGARCLLLVPQAGGSDYVCKPFAQKELVARIQAQLRTRMYCRGVRLYAPPPPPVPPPPPATVPGAAAEAAAAAGRRAVAPGGRDASWDSAGSADAAAGGFGGEGALAAHCSVPAEAAREVLMPSSSGAGSVRRRPAAGLHS